MKKWPTHGKFDENILFLSRNFNIFRLPLENVGYKCNSKISQGNLKVIMNLVMMTVRSSIIRLTQLQLFARVGKKASWIHCNFFCLSISVALSLSLSL